MNTGRAGAHPGGHLLHQFGRHAERCGNAVIHRVRASPVSELETCRGVREYQIWIHEAQKRVDEDDSWSPQELSAGPKKKMLRC